MCGMIGSIFASCSKFVAARTTREDRNTNNLLLAAFRLHIPRFMLAIIGALTFGAECHHIHRSWLYWKVKLRFFSHISVQKLQFGLENRQNGYFDIQNRRKQSHASIFFSQNTV